jgi:hypothetical protein
MAKQTDLTMKRGDAHQNLMKEKRRIMMNAEIGRQVEAWN